MSKEPRLKDKVCLISGASRGFGQAIAVRFVEEGARVALLSRTSCDETMKLIASIEGVDKVEDRAAWIPCDIGTEEDCKKAIEGCVAKFGDVIHGERRGGGRERSRGEGMAWCLLRDTLTACLPACLPGAVLVNNAALFVFHSVEHATADDWDRSAAINIKGHALLTKAALPHMKKAGAEGA